VETLQAKVKQLTDEIIVERSATENAKVCDLEICVNMVIMSLFTEPIG